jgi:hypothetical protein
MLIFNSSGQTAFIGHRLRTFRMDVAQYYPFCT